MSFKIGDRIEIISTMDGCKGAQGNITTTTRNYDIPYGVVLDKPLVVTDGYGPSDWGVKEKHRNWIGREYELKLIKEATMKERIEALTSWDKAADDILWEIYDYGNHYFIMIGIGRNSSEGIEIRNDSGKEILTTFGYSSQCEKLEAFKKALLWLAEKSGKLKDTSKIKEEIADLKHRIAKLEDKL